MLTYVSNSTYFCDKYLLRNASKKILNQSRFDKPYGYFYRYKGVFNHKNGVSFCKSFQITDGYTVVRNEMIFSSTHCLLMVFCPFFIPTFLSLAAILWPCPSHLQFYIVHALPCFYTQWQWNTSSFLYCRYYLLAVALATKGNTVRF